MEELNSVMGLAIDEINQTFPESMIQNEDQFVLIGKGSSVDSLALVSLIISIEGNIQKSLGKRVSLVNEDSFNMTQSPFSTVGSLKTYIAELVNGSK
jgi:acyl carrier protein